MLQLLQSAIKKLTVTGLFLLLAQNFPVSHSTTFGAINSRLKLNSPESLNQSNFVQMSSQDRNSEIMSESSALRELKEIIKKQAAEIETLKKMAKTTKAVSTSHGHHGPPEGDEMDIESYLSSTFYELALKRVGWLAVFLCSLSLTAVIMQGFEHTLSRQIELAYFVPLLAGHGGNTGGQTVGTVLSSLSNGSITTKDAFRVIRKEAMSGLTVGFILGSLVGPIAHYFAGISWHVSTVVFCTLPLLSFIAATLASTIPFACKAVGLDPAIIAAPAMTSFVDVTGLLSYFLIANRVFKFFGLEL